MGAGGRPVRSGLAASRCWTRRTSRGIRVVLGTPTYADPDVAGSGSYPEIAGGDRDRAPPWLGRPPGDGLHPRGVPASTPSAMHPRRRRAGTSGTPRSSATRSTTSRVSDAALQRGRVPGVSSTASATEYGTVEALNEAWGLVYWSHRLSTWADLWRPDGNFQPQYDLAWRRYQADLVTEFIGWQADLVHTIVGPGRRSSRPASRTSSPASRTWTSQRPPRHRLRQRVLRDGRLPRAPEQSRTAIDRADGLGRPRRLGR